MKLRFICILLLFGCVKSSFSQTAFTKGNIVVSRISSGAGPYTSTNPVYLDEYTPSGTFVRTFAMPTTAGAALYQNYVNVEGGLTASADGQYLTLVGYSNSAASGSGFNSSTAIINPRSIGVAKYDGTATVIVPSVTTPAASGAGAFTAGVSPTPSTVVLSSLTGTVAVGQFVYGNWIPNGATVASISGTAPNLTITLSNSGGTTNTGNNNFLFMPTSTPSYANTVSPGSAVTTNGTDFWLCSRESSLQYYNSTSGLLTNIASGTTGTTARSLGIFNGQLFGVNDYGFKLMSIGTGMPTSSTSTAGLPYSTSPNSFPPGQPRSFFMVDASSTESGADILYVAQAISLGGGSNTANNAIIKYKKVNGLWVVNGGYGAFTDNYYGLTAIWDGTNLTIFAIRKAGAQGPGGELVKIVDAGGYANAMSGTETVLAAYNTGNNLGGAWRGVAFAPSIKPINAAGDIYYFMPSLGDANVLSNWNTKPDGSGVPPGSLYNTNRIYIINNGRSATLTGSFGGDGVSISVGDETGGNLTTGTSGTLTTIAGNAFLRATVNINKNSVLNYRMTPSASYYPNLSFCDSASIVNYNGTAAQNVIVANYGKLNINNSAGVTLLGDIGISSTLTNAAGTVNTITNNASIKFNGLLMQTMPGNNAFTGGNIHQIIINNDAGVKLADGETLTVLDSLIVNSGTLTLGTGSSLMVKGKSYIPTTSQVDSTYKPGYTLVWNDEFNGPANSFPNPKYWVQHYTDTATTTVTFWGQNFLQKNVKNYNYLDGNGNYVSKINDSAGVYYVGGGIATAWPYSFIKQYGYMECKMTFTPNNGVNSAFWLQSPTISGNPAADDPATYGTEIDVCEYLGPSTVAPHGRVNTTIHKNGYGTYHQQIANANAATVSNLGWHTVAVEWTPTYYKFYTDGVLTWTLADPTYMSKRPLFLLFTNAIGWTPPNQPGNTWPVYMNVDYVRVYNKN